MYRKYLKLSFFVLIVVGILSSLVPFVSSLKPNDKSLSNAPHFDLSSVKIGQLGEFNVPHFKILISKQHNSEITVLAIPYRNGHYQLPEFDWQRPMLPCQSFIQNFGYQCLDTIAGNPVWYKYMQWDMNGNYTGDKKWDKEVPNLIIPKYKISADQLIYLGV